MLMMAGGLALLIRFWSAISKPSGEFAQVAMTIAALGAAALAYSASRIASPSSTFTPGSEQLLVPDGGAGWTVLNVAPVYPDRPKAERRSFRRRAGKNPLSRTKLWFG